MPLKSNTNAITLFFITHRTTETSINKPTRNIPKMTIIETQTSGYSFSSYSCSITRNHQYSLSFCAFWQLAVEKSRGLEKQGFRKNTRFRTLHPSIYAPDYPSVNPSTHATTYLSIFPSTQPSLTNIENILWVLSRDTEVNKVEIR